MCLVWTGEGILGFKKTINHFCVHITELNTIVLSGSVIIIINLIPITIEYWILKTILSNKYGYIYWHLNSLK